MRSPPEPSRSPETAASAWGSSALRREGAGANDTNTRAPAPMMIGALHRNVRITNSSPTPTRESLIRPAPPTNRVILPDQGEQKVKLCAAVCQRPGKVGAGECGRGLLGWDFRLHDWRVHAVHMIFVAQQAVLASRAAVVAGLAEILFHRTEIGHEVSRIALLVALQVGRGFFTGRGFFKDMAGQAAAILQDAYALTDPDRLEMRLMDETGEASPFALGQRRGEIDDAPLAFHIVNAVAFRA